jgi:hypothetical protein
VRPICLGFSQSLRHIPRPGERLPFSFGARPRAPLEAFLGSDRAASLECWTARDTRRACLRVPSVTIAPQTTTTTKSTITTTAPAAPAAPAAPTTTTTTTTTTAAVAAPVKPKTKPASEDLQ